MISRAVLGGWRLEGAVARAARSVPGTPPHTSPAAPCQPGRRAAGSRQFRGEAGMDLGLRGRRALVMGGTKGLGRSIADALAAEGAALVISGRDQGRLDEAAAKLR